MKRETLVIAAVLALLTVAAWLAASAGGSSQAGSVAAGVSAKAQAATAAGEAQTPDAAAPRADAPAAPTTTAPSTGAATPDREGPSGPLAQQPDAPPPVDPAFVGTVPAPDFPPGLDWLNVSRPLSLQDLRGKVVLLDFWTYGCVNCMHVIPALKALEAKYHDELVVIGVHSGKFDSERATENIRNVVLRYGLEHPVVNDRDFEVWNAYSARAWPTFMLIDPQGRILGVHEGEGIYEPFDVVIGAVVAAYDAAGLIDRRPLETIALESAPPTPLRFPGKVLADAKGGRLFIADTNHHRIVVTDLEGTVLDVVGNGEEGFADGDFAAARFRKPQGLTLAPSDLLYVADTENHAIRAVDLKARAVTTVAGIGRQGPLRESPVDALRTPMRSPWDVLYEGGGVLIAMAGQHQLWRLDLLRGTLERFAGSGREQLLDAPLAMAGLNQPSGLATDGQRLFVADSEASAIRVAPLRPAPETAFLATLVGTGLFDFGDVDGVGDEVRLQHPLGVAFHDGKLYIADTYNGKIKWLDPERQEVRTLLGSGEPGWRDGPATEARFDEPGGLSFAGNRLYIADTNNHVIRVADLAAGPARATVRTLELRDPSGLLVRRNDDGLTRVVRTEPVRVAPGSRELLLDVKLPPDYRFNELAPFSATWTSSSKAVRFGEASLSAVLPEFPLRLPVTLSEGRAEVGGELVIYYCAYAATQLCLIEQVQLQVPVEVVADGAPALEVTYEVPVPEAPTVP